MKRKSKISRSVFQHQVEENKKLLRDIKILVTQRGFKALKVRMRWWEHFKKEKEIASFIKAGAKEYYRKHPELNFPKKDLEK